MHQVTHNATQNMTYLIVRRECLLRGRERGARGRRLAARVRRRVALLLRRLRVRDLDRRFGRNDGSFSNEVT